MKSLLVRIGWMCAVVCVTVASAMADGESRPATSLEKNYVLNVMKKFDKAMPKGPDGWAETERTEVKEPERMGVGAAMGPMRVYYRAKWENQAAKAAAQERMIEQSRSIQMPDQTAMNAMNAEIETLTRKMMEAVQKGDMATVEKLQKKTEAISEKQRSAYKSTDDQMRKIQQSQPTDVEIDIQFAANQFEETLHQAVRQSPVNGVPVYRVDEKNQDTPRPGTSYIFLGDWLPRDQPEYLLIRAEPRADMPPASVQTIMVTVRGDDVRARQMIKAIDWEGLKGLLGK